MNSLSVYKKRSPPLHWRAERRNPQGVLWYIAPYAVEVIGFVLEGLCETTFRLRAGSKQTSRWGRDADTYLPQVHSFTRVCEPE